MANETPCDRCGHVMEDVSVENEQAREKGDATPPALRSRRFRCPECGAEKTVAEIAHDGEVESWENEGGKCVKQGRRPMGRIAATEGGPHRPWATGVVTHTSSRTAHARRCTLRSVLESGHD